MCRRGIFTGCNFFLDIFYFKIGNQVSIRMIHQDLLLDYHDFHDRCFLDENIEVYVTACKQWQTILT